MAGVDVVMHNQFGEVGAPSGRLPGACRACACRFIRLNRAGHTAWWILATSTELGVRSSYTVAQRHDDLGNGAGDEDLATSSRSGTRGLTRVTTRPFISSAPASTRRTLPGVPRVHVTGRYRQRIRRPRSARTSRTSCSEAKRHCWSVSEASPPTACGICGGGRGKSWSNRACARSCGPRSRVW